MWGGGQEITRTWHNDDSNKVDNDDFEFVMALIRTIEAEKRTHFAELRTGIGVMAIPLSLLTILIATSDYYSVGQVIGLIIGLIIGIIVLVAIGMYLVVDSLKRLKHKRRLLRRLGLDSESIGTKVKERLEDH